MPDLLSNIFLLFCLLQIKHMFADYFLQTRWMLAGRGEYLHLGRAVHAGIHALGSAFALLLVGVDPGLTLAIISVEWIAHFNIDWAKAYYSEVRDLKPDQARFWQASGVDQALHQFTYVVMVWVVVRYWIS